MAFEPMTAEQYRGLSAEEFEQRKNAFVEACESGDADIEQVRAEKEIIKEESARRATIAELRSLAMSNVAAGAGSVVSAQSALKTRSAVVEEADMTESTEYRNAFKDLVLHRKAMPVELRANTLTSDVAAAIPTVLVNKIVERMDQCGMILPLVSRTNHAAGIVIPTSTVKPVATWVAEGAGSDRQKKAVASITFTHFKLRCEISMSMEVGTMALSAFEAKFVENVSKAMVIAIEKSILAGDGATQPKGILKETPVANVTFAAAIPTYEEIVAAEAAVPVEFEGTAKWAMTKAQFMNIMSATDKNGQPIARVNYGIGGKLERTILGRDVVIHPYADEMGEYAAFIFDFADYALNTVYDMGIQRKQDWDTEDLLTKAVMSVDGKVIDAGSLVAVKVGA